MFLKRLPWLFGGSCLGIASSISLSPNDRKQQRVLAESSLPTDYSSAIALSREYVETERLLQGIPGLTIAVIKDNALIWSEGFGFADIENRIAATPNSLMRIASISKPLTTTGIGVLLHRKELDLNQTVQHYIADYPLVPYKVSGGDEKQEEDSNDNKESKDKDSKSVDRVSDELCSITVEELCNHQSGIRNYKNDEFHSMKTYRTCKDTLDIFKNDALEFKPGSNYSYSTYNYCVLSAIMESVTNQKFIHFMKDEVLNPLKLHHTFYETNKNLLLHRSKQYIRNKDGDDLLIRNIKEYGPSPYSKKKYRLYNAPFVDNSNKFAGGGYVSTSGDIAQFGNAVVLGDFLDEEVKKQLFLDVDNEYNYGLGWMVYRNGKGEIMEISHSGGSVGGCSHLLVVPKERLVIAILINLQDANPYITRQVAQYFAD